MFRVQEVDVIRTARVSTMLAATMLTSSAVQAAAPVYAAVALTQATAQDAAPFIGDWTLEMQGPNGPGTFILSIKVENDKVAGEIGSDATGVQKIASVSKTEKGLALNYTFPWEGNAIDAVISLTPGTEGKTAAQIDFAGGAYTMTGTATKKEKAKGL
jgi:hypothetical protein